MNSRRDFLQKLAASAVALPFLSTQDVFGKTSADPGDPAAPTLRVALMGLGGYASRVAEAIQSCKRVKITGLISGTPAKLQGWGEKYGVPEESRYNYGNFDEIKNNPMIDAVYVITPNALHHSQVIRGIRRRSRSSAPKPTANRYAAGWVSPAETGSAAITSATPRVIASASTASTSHGETLVSGAWSADMSHSVRVRAPAVG